MTQEHGELSSITISTIMETRRTTLSQCENLEEMILLIWSSESYALDATNRISHLLAFVFQCSELPQFMSSIESGLGDFGMMSDEGMSHDEEMNLEYELFDNVLPSGGHVTVLDLSPKMIQVPVMKFFA